MQNENMIVALFFVLLIFTCEVRAQAIGEQDVMTNDPQEGAAFSAYIENDARVLGGPGTDRAYSNGFKFSYIYSQNKSPSWSTKPIRYFQALRDEFKKAESNFGISISQQIYTPSNIHVSELIRNDRPYAAWLYAGFGVSFKEESRAHFLELDLGTVGPSAQGEQVQNNFHNLISDPRALGWDNGLHDEPTLEILYEQRIKYYAVRYFDFIPAYGADLGNVSIAGHIAGLVRLGYNLPNDFGPTRPSAGEGDSFVSPKTMPTGKFSLYAFAGMRGNAVGRNIFLDGNTFRSSQSVKKYRVTSETEVGFGTQYAPVSIVWSYVVRSPEFEEQSYFNSFASVHIIYSL